MRKAIYIPYAQAMPNIATIDKDPCVYIQSGGKKCGACIKFCEANAIDFNQADQVIELKVGTIILATGYSLLDPSKIPQYGYGKYDNVITGLEFERITCAHGHSHWSRYSYQCHEAGRKGGANRNEFRRLDGET